LKSTKRLENARATLRARVPFYDKDRYFATDIEKANDLLLEAVHNETMPEGLLPSFVV
jgi:histidine ammonia-lyase